MTVSLLAMDTSETSKRTGFSEAWLNQMRCAGKGPAYLKIGRRVLYRPADVEKWLEAHLRETKAA